VLSSKLHIAFTIIALITLGKAPIVAPARNPDLQIKVRMTITRDPDA
jgi:hypothetical protein